ncbi:MULTISPECIES: hypothetical protein [Bacillus cereus group]|uniref:hypothetical protein n=1 Tax=Bacillus cereus group TaxID=86661 RepID=UPI001C8B2411|nr:hypothetical protein [Bacillus cereus]MBX9158634.1 hypothetical protein [Bacillus cereus]
MEFKLFETRVRFNTDKGELEGLVVGSSHEGKALYVWDADGKVWEVGIRKVTII